MSEWKQRAKAGDVKAMFKLGVSYYHGRGGVAEDYGEALVWWGKAAATGHRHALFNMGVMHQNGLGTPVNLLNALSYYKQAHAKGYKGTADLAAEIARIEAAIAADPALRAASAAAAAGSSAGSAADKQRPAKKARLEKDKSEGLLEQERILEAEKARVQQREDAVKKREAEAKQKETTLKRRETIVKKREAAVEQREAEVQRRIDELEAAQRAKEAAVAAFTANKRTVAVDQQAQVIGERRAEARSFAAKRDGIAKAWAMTAADLFHCLPCARDIAPGQSVLLDQCLHAICRACVPHMLQANNTVVCPVCQTVSTLSPASLPHHPLVEAELVSDAAQGCIMCQTAPEGERLPASTKCGSCTPERLLCEAHSLHHRLLMPSHAIVPLPHGGAAPRCATHDQPIAAYCTTCDALVCLACFASTHPTATHDVNLLTDTAFVESVRARLIEGVSAARTVMLSLIEYGADAMIAVTELDERDAAIAAEVDRTINVLIGLLERRRASMHDRCAAQSREERAALHTTRQEREHRWRMLSSAADLAERLATGTRLGPNAAVVLMQLQSAAMARMSIAAGHKPAGVPAPSILRFHVDDAVAEQLVTLGAIVQDAP